MDTVISLNRRRVVRALRASPWDFSNGVLYDLCRTHPAHDDESVIIAKMHLIVADHVKA
jgi:hypothetical protein